MATDPQKWRRILEILDRVAREARERRRERIDEWTVGDPGLRSTVLGILEAAESYENDATDRTRTVDPAPIDPNAAPRILGYTLRQRIGRGGFGEVWVATQHVPVSRDQVAVKILHRPSDSRDFLRRFELEKRALSLMTHPNIAKVLDAGLTEDGRPFFTMEYIKGVPLTQHCDRGRLGIADRLRLFVEVCKAIHHAHQKTIVHRDIKPGNILVSFESGPGTPKVIDFGIAKAIGHPVVDDISDYVSGRVIGTIDYMPPEQIDPNPQEVDTRSDIYSLGALLHELLVSVVPFDSTTADRVYGRDIRTVIREVVPPTPSKRLTSLDHPEVERVARARQTSPAALCRELRGDLDAIVMKCLEKDRVRRYESAIDLARDVERHLAGEPVSAVGRGAVYVTKKFVTRHRGAVTGSAALAIVLVIAIVLGTRGWYAEAELGRQKAARLVDEAFPVAFKDPTRAKALLDEAERLDRRSAGPPLTRLRLQLLGPHPEAAVDTARQLVGRFPESGEAAAVYAAALRSSDPVESDRWAAKAEALLRSSVGDAQSKSLVQFALGLGERDLDARLGRLDRSLDFYPWNFEALWQRSVVRFDRANRRKSEGDAAGAIADYRAALADAEVMRRVRDALSLTWIQSAAIRMALDAHVDPAPPEERQVPRDQLDRALELDPGSWLGHFNRGLWFARNGDLERALADFDAALARDPNQLAPLVEKSRVHFELRQWEPCIEAATRAVDLEAASPSATDSAAWEHRMTRAGARAKRREFAAALADYTAALATAPSHERAELLTSRAQMQLALENFSEARDDAALAVGLDAQDPRAANVLGKALALVGHGDEAIPHLDRAVALVPEQNRPIFRLERGVVYWRLGRDEAALRDIEPYAEQNDADASWIWLWVWEIETLRGNAAGAAQALAAARRTDQPLLRSVLQSLDGQVSAQAVFEQGTTDAERLLVSHALGTIAFTEGRRDEAAHWFGICTRLGFGNWTEHQLAAWHLSRLTGRS